MALTALASVASAGVAQAAAPAPQWRANGRVLGEGQREGFIAFGEVRLAPAGGGEPFRCKEVYSGEALNEAGRGLVEVTGLTSSCAGVEPLGCVIEPKKKPNCVEPVFLTAEMPGASPEEEGEVCTAPSKAPRECPAADERTTETLISRVRRGTSSLPWKGELIEGEREGETAVLMKLGEGHFGEGAETGSAGLESGACYPTETVESEDGEPETVAAGWQQLPAGCLALNLFLPDTPVELLLYGGLELEVVNGSKTALYPTRLTAEEDQGLWVSGPSEGYHLTGGWQMIGTAGITLLSAT